jgi:hypothetical protein
MARNNGSQQWDASRKEFTNPTDKAPASDGGLSKVMSAASRERLAEFKAELALRKALQTADGLSTITVQARTMFDWEHEINERRNK